MKPEQQPAREFMKDKRYIGIADAHGIESFIQKDEGAPMTLMLRAQCNRQRHALVYEVSLDDQEKAVVDKMIKRQDFKEALRFLKVQPSFAVEKCMQRSATLIPDDGLDPYWNQEVA